MPLAVQAERNVSISANLVNDIDPVERELSALSAAGDRQTSSGIAVPPASSVLSGDVIPEVNHRTASSRFIHQVSEQQAASAPAHAASARLRSPRGGASVHPAPAGLLLPAVPEDAAASPASSQPSPARRGVFVPERQGRAGSGGFETSALRIAMVVTKAPSEPLEVVQRTLLAMLAQVGRGGGQGVGVAP